MSTSVKAGSEEYGGGVPWGDVLLSAVASVSWALIGMGGTAALGLHLLDADAAGSLGTMTAAVVALGAGGSVTPSGDVSAFGLKGAEAHTAIEITPLGVGLVGALLLSFFFLRSLRAAGVVVAPAELLARAGAVVGLFVAMTGGLAWAGHDVVTIDGGSLGLDGLPGGGGGGDGGGGDGGGLEIPGLGDVGDIGGLLPDRVGDLVGAHASVGFTVDTVPTLLGGLLWSAGVLLVALLASRRTPLPRGWEAVHRVVRPAVSALVTVALTAVAAGLAAAAWAAVGDDHPRRIAGAALLGAPNGVWLGVPLGLFVPWDGRATGALTGVLPAPVDDLLGSGTGEPVTLGRLTELDGRVWLLGVAAALLMLTAGVLTAVRTPVGASAGAPVGAPVGVGAEFGAVSGTGVGTAPGPGAGAAFGTAPGAVASAASGAVPGRASALGFAARCALRLGVATALALPLLALLTEVSVDASLSVLGIDAFGAGLDLHGRLGPAVLLGGVWGAGAGAAGALLARVCGAAGAGATPLALSALTVTEGVGGRGGGGGGGGGGGDPAAARALWAGPYRPSLPHRPPNASTNPYLRWRDRAEPGPQEGRPGQEDGAGQKDRAGQEGDAGGRYDVYGAPTVAGQPGPAPGTPSRPPRPGERPSSRPWGEAPPPPPPPPAPPRRRGDGR
ncbi:streptophobe family protein [Streptomyces sp. enrichment culture]|uniref:streptophobe family protein n=1 Tax=Streptomyces sp. enrichment culture TaxID=1795815 RepID=UPI003F54426F